MNDRKASLPIRQRDDKPTGPPSSQESNEERHCKAANKSSPGGGNDPGEDDSLSDVTRKGYALLELPPEVFDQIMEACAANGAFSRCCFDDFPLFSVCKTFSEAIVPLIPVPGRFNIHCLERLVIRVDLSYQDGEWLKISLFWRPRHQHPNSELFQLAVNPQDLADETLRF